MSQTKPIKNIDEMHAFRDYYLQEDYNVRNYVLIVFGLNTALRISDLLTVRWRDVFSFQKQCVKKHLEITESKTGKHNTIALNSSVTSALLLYKKYLTHISMEDFLFPSPKDPSAHLSRCQAYRIVKRAACAVGIEVVIGCHSMRKTFGYQASKQGISPAVLMNIYNHSSYQITKRYLDIDQDDKDETFCKVTL